jgi:crotonobetainyl-CoA:carnitine CoA-transferase CaiB-like acyl-CoA transferase
MKRLGLDYDSLSKTNPRIITASASGFGTEGPNTYEPSFDIIGQGMGGIMIAQGGGPGREPVNLIGGFADQVGAMVFALGITTAIIARELHGVGQHVDVSLLGSQIAIQNLSLQTFLRHGNQGQSVNKQNPLFTFYTGSDGKSLTIGLLDPKWWPSLCSVLCREDLMTDPRFEEPRGRYENRDELIAELEEAFSKQPRDYWIKALKEADVPCGPVNDYAEVAAEEQVLANDYITEVDHPLFGPVRVPGSPIRMSKHETGPRAFAPELGQHTEEILLDLGYEWEEIAKLKDEKII